MRLAVDDVSAGAVTMTEIARRVVARGWADTMTRQRVAQLAETDPAWPVPQQEWRRVGRYWMIPWDRRLEEYFTARDRTPGPKAWRHREPRRRA